MTAKFLLWIMLCTTVLNAQVSTDSIKADTLKNPAGTINLIINSL